MYRHRKKDLNHKGSKNEKGPSRRMPEKGKGLNAHPDWFLSFLRIYSLLSAASLVSLRKEEGHHLVKEAERQL